MANFFALFTQQIGELLNSQNGARRLMALIIVVASLGGLGYLMTRARTGSFKTLYSNLQPAEAAEAGARLQQIGIPIRFAEGGTTLQVSSRKWSQALMILARDGFPASGISGYELLDKSSIGLSDFEQKVRFHRSLEGELARTIMTIEQIERARVHLAMPKPSIFVGRDDAAGPTASVVLKVRRGMRLMANEVEGIGRLVAHSVEGLEPGSVSIVNFQGRELNHAAEGESTSAVGGWIDYKVDYENRLKERIETMLARTVGVGKVTARVNADFDFSERTETKETYDPDSKVIRSEIVREDVPAPVEQAVAEGPAGSTSNLGSEPIGSGVTSTSVVNGRLARETHYELSRTTTQVVDKVPQLQRITVSVLLDGNYEEVDDGSGVMVRQFRPLSTEELRRFEDAVKNIVGFREDRSSDLGDVVSVASVQFEIDDLDEEEEPAAEGFLRPEMIEELVPWAVIGLIGILVVFTVLRPAVKSITLVSVAAGHRPGLPGPVRSRGGEPGPSGTEEEVRGLPEAEMEQSEEEADGRDKAANRRQRSAQLQRDLTQATKDNSVKAASVVRQWLEQ